MPDLGERIDLPNDQSLYYVDADHSYWRCKPDGKRGKRLTGVTTAIKPIDFDPSALLKWAARTNGEGIAILAADALCCEDVDEMRGALEWLSSAETIWRELEAHSLTFEDLRDAKAEVGTAVHELALGALARGEAVPDYSALSQDEAGYVEGMVDFWLDHDPVPTHVEQVVADPDVLGVAGRFDLRAELTSKCGKDTCPCRHGGMAMIDAKTSKWIFESPHAQIAGYRHLAEVCGLGETDWGAILHLRPDGTYELIEAQADTDDFLGAVGVYRSKAAIKRRVNAARKSPQPVAA